MLDCMARSLPAQWGAMLAADLAVAQVAEQVLAPPDYYVTIALEGYQHLSSVPGGTTLLGLGLFDDANGNQLMLEVMGDHNERLLEVHFHQLTKLPPGTWLPESFVLARFE